MFENRRPLVLGLTLVSLTAFFSGCDRIQKLTKNLKPAEPTKPAVVGTYSSAQVSVLDPAGFETFTTQKDKLVIVDFHAEWCAPCKLMGPALEKAAAAHPGVVFVGKVDVDKAGALAAAQKVSGIPDVRIFKNGKEVDRIVGFPGDDAILEKVAGFAAGVTPAATIKPPASTEPKIQTMKKDWMPQGIQRR